MGAAATSAGLVGESEMIDYESYTESRAVDESTVTHVAATESAAVASCNVPATPLASFDQSHPPSGESPCVQRTSTTSSSRWNPTRLEFLNVLHNAGIRGKVTGRRDEPDAMKQ